MFCKIVRKLAKVAPKVAPPCGSPQLLPKASPQSGFGKLRCKIATEAALQSCVLKLVPKAAVFQSCCSKLPRKAAPQSCSFFPRLLPKAAPQSFFPKPLPKVVIESCSEHLFPQAAKALPKLLSKATPQSCRSSKQLFVNVTAKPQSCSPKLLFKVATESRVPKKLPKTPKLFPEAASKLVRRAVWCTKKRRKEHDLSHDETQKRARLGAGRNAENR